MELNEQLNELIGEIGKLTRVVDASNAKAKDADGARLAEANEALAALAKKASDLDADRQAKAEAAAHAERDAEVKALVEDAVKAALKSTHAPSLASIIGSGTTSDVRDRATAMVSVHPSIKAAYPSAEPGALISAIMGLKGNPDEYAEAKASLDRYGFRYASQPEGKATLGTTGATGGYVLPNNLVDTLIKPATQTAVWQKLVTVVNGVNVRGVDQPYRLGAPTRMTFQNWGATKENLDESYGSYTANLGTLARVYDISKQYARFSAGAAEADVIDELTKAAVLGENYYIAAGNGTVNNGTGDPTIGIYTALNGASAFTNVNKAFAAASVSTVAGSFANALAQAQLNLAVRSRQAEAFVCDATTFWTAIGEGSDTAGFWVSPTGGPTGFTRTASGGLSFWGVPVYYDANLGTNATTKIVIGGEFSAVKFYRGMEFRIDSSDVAGTRWDQNLIGFRGEEEIGINAYTAVNVGALQLMTAVIP